MRSRYADYFNHDEDAGDYDADVAREEDPVRAGYSELLRWVGRRIPPGSRVLDLGAGTGNTVLALPIDCTVTAVDVSTKMTEIARAKLRGRSVAFVAGDILEYVESASLDGFDSIVSTYALHHLTPHERSCLFGRIESEADLRMRIVVGDLMYRNEADRERIIRKFSISNPQFADVIADEFFWDIDDTNEMFQRLGWRTSWERFSDLSWGFEVTSR